MLPGRHFWEAKLLQLILVILSHQTKFEPIFSFFVLSQRLLLVLSDASALIFFCNKKFRQKNRHEKCKFSASHRKCSQLKPKLNYMKEHIVKQLYTIFIPCIMIKNIRLKQ